MAQLLPYKGGYYLWKYVPSLPGAIIFAILFTLATGFHGWRMFRYRVWFHIPFLLGCIFEVIGYVAFAIAHDNTDQLLPYIIQSVFLLVAPALFAASIYMILGRLIVRLPSGPTCSFIRPSWLTKVFVFGDVFSFLLQSSGGGLMAQGSSQDLGQTIIIVGLVLQIVMFGLFVLVAVVFHIRYGRMCSATAALGSSTGRAEAGIPWRKVLWMLYAVSMAILIRSIFRVIEYVAGQTGYPLTHQWTLFIFDSLLMFLATLLFYVMYHPNDMVRVGQEDGYSTVEASTSLEMPLRK